MAAIGRLVLILAVVGAPWVFGSVQPLPQLILAIVVIAATVLRLVESTLQRPDTAVHIPLASIVPLAFLLIAAVQLLPRPSTVAAGMEGAEFQEYTAVFEGPDHVATGTLAPASTRREAARLFFALAAFLVAAQWFAEPQTHRSLFGALAVNGVVLGGFGIVQSLSWNGMMFWSVPLRFGGTPFASYVNRNNAAGYLNLSIAAAVGLGILLIGRSTVSGDLQESRTPLLTSRWLQLRYAISKTEGRHLAVIGMVTVTATSLLFSLSRGGIVAMVAAGIALACLVFRRVSRTAIVGFVLAVSLAAVGLLSFAGEFESVDKRLGTLSNPFKAAAGRVQHWSDTASVLSDFPILGTGFGTYRFANQPYQQHPSHAWYYNADNEWFEILVETGGVGLAAMIAGFLLISICAGSLLRSTDPQWRAAGAVGVFIVVSQGLQAFTDFGLNIPANALTFAVLCGAVCGAACREAEFRQIRVPFSLGLARLEGRASQSLFTVAIVLSGIAFLVEMSTATYAAMARDAQFDIRPNDTRIAAIDAVIDEAKTAARLRPDDGELLQMIGEMLINRCELQMYRRLQEDLPEKDRPKQPDIWKASQISRLALRVRELDREGQQAEANRIRSLLAVTDNLPEAMRYYEQAIRHYPLARGAAISLARLNALNSAGTSSRSVGYLQRAAFTAPSSPSTLMETAELSWNIGEEPLADKCWTRTADVDPELSPQVWQTALKGRSSEHVLSSAIPNRAEAIIEIAESVAETPTRKLLIERAKGLLDKAPDSVSPLIRGKFAELTNDPDQAIYYYEESLSLHPEDIETRLRLARIFRKNGRFAEADMEYSLLSQQVPNRKDIQAEKAEVQRELTQSIMSESDQQTD